MLKEVTVIGQRLYDENPGYDPIEPPYVRKVGNGMWYFEATSGYPPGYYTEPSTEALNKYFKNKFCGTSNVKDLRVDFPGGQLADGTKITDDGYITSPDGIKALGQTFPLTNPDGTYNGNVAIVIAPAAFTDDATLHAVLGHELIHAMHVKEHLDLLASNREQWLINSEWAAYNWTANSLVISGQAQQALGFAEIRDTDYGAGANQFNSNYGDCIPYK